jgi:deazaflavin-dependent oxidoreductase (nitroreductase family)
VVASFAGSDIAPHWYRNLRVHPEVGVELKSGGGGRYRARSLTAEEARPIWPKLLAMYPTYATYQRWTKRQIPVVELTPLGG